MATKETKKRFGWKKWVFLAAIVAFFAYRISPELSFLVLKFSGFTIASIALTYLAYRTGKDAVFAPLPNQAAIIYRWGFGDKEGARTGKVLYEKDVLPLLRLCVKLPWIEKVKFEELKLRSIPFETTFMAADDTGLTLPGTLFYKPDFTVLNDSGIPIYGTTTEKEIETQAMAVANQKIGAIGGSHKSESFLRKLPTIAQILNQAFRLPHLAHIDHDPATCTVEKCKFPEGTKIQVNDLDRFHASHWHWVDEKLKHEGDAEHATERSKLETMNGIDVVEVRVSPPTLSEESKKARERKREYTDLEQALTHKIGALKSVSAIPGASFQAASNVVAEVFHPKSTTRQVNSFEGIGEMGPLLGLVAAAAKTVAPPAQTAATQPDIAVPDRKGSKGKRGGRK